MSDFVAKKRISKKEIFILILLALIVVFPGLYIRLSNVIDYRIMVIMRTEL